MLFEQRRWGGLSTDIAYEYSHRALTFESTPGPECFVLLFRGSDVCPKVVKDELSAKGFGQSISKRNVDEDKEGIFCEEQRSFVRIGDGSKGHIVTLTF